ncbi:hypothetical protein BKG58_22565 [Mycobacteroides abscessus subsp. abscessus]|nr:hypothetical protein BKG58_22565 [Mycobacteroides abscessus subsp. abscessus]
MDLQKIWVSRDAGPEARKAEAALIRLDGTRCEFKPLPFREVVQLATRLFGPGDVYELGCLHLDLADVS